MLHAKKVREAAYESIEIVQVPGPFTHEPRLAVLRRFGVSREEDGRGDALLGKVASSGQVDRGDLEDRDASAVVDVASRRVEHARAERRARHRLRDGRRVHYPQRIGRDARSVRREHPQPRRIDERVRDDLLEPEADERVARSFPELLERVTLGERQRSVGDAHRQPVVASDPADLLDDVLGDRDVRPDDRRCRDERVAVGRGRELEPPEDVEGLFRRHLDAEDAGHVGEAHANVDPRARPRVAVDEAGDRRAGVLAQEPARAGEGHRHQIRRKLPGEATRRGASRGSVQAEQPGRLADAPRLEGGALEGDRRRRRTDLGVLATEDPGDAERALRVGDDERAVGKDPVDAVERAQRLASSCRPRDEEAAAEHGVVVRVQRLTELEHDVVGDVDDVVDRPHARRHEPCLHPSGRGSDANVVEQGRGEPRARHVVLDTYVEAPRRLFREPLERRLAQSRAEERARLAGDPDHAETVGAVRLQLEREDRLAEHLAKQGAHGEPGVEDLDPLVVLTEPELLRREDHPLALDAPHLRGLEDRAFAGVAIDDLGAFVRVRDDRAFGQVRRAGHHGLRLTRAVGDGRELELVRIRVLRKFFDAPDSDLVVPPGPLDALHLGARHMQLQRELVDGHGDVHVLAQPRHRDLDEHQNCSKNRRSF